MLFQSQSKKELRALWTLDQIGFLINLHECLTRIRANDIEDATDTMEMCLDYQILAIQRAMEKCDDVTRDLVATQLQRLWAYRKGAPGYSSNYLEKTERDLRRSILETRAEAEKILDEYKSYKGLCVQDEKR
jgi:hypothetical protein